MLTYEYEYEYEYEYTSKRNGSYVRKMVEQKMPDFSLHAEIDLKNQLMWYKTTNCDTRAGYIVCMDRRELSQEEGLKRANLGYHQEPTTPEEINQMLIDTYLFWRSEEIQSKMEKEPTIYGNIQYALLIYIAEIPEIKPWFDIRQGSDNTIENAISHWCSSQNTTTHLQELDAILKQYKNPTLTIESEEPLFND